MGSYLGSGFFFQVLTRCRREWTTEDDAASVCSISSTENPSTLKKPGAAMKRPAMMKRPAAVMKRPSAGNIPKMPKQRWVKMYHKKIWKVPSKTTIRMGSKFVNLEEKNGVGNACMGSWTEPSSDLRTRKWLKVKPKLGVPKSSHRLM